MCDITAVRAGKGIQAMDRVRCNQCWGFGVIVGPRGTPDAVCPMCKGRGQLPSRDVLWKQRGRVLRAERESRGLSLGKAAAALGINKSNLSNMENGKISPRNVWLGSRVGLKHKRESGK